MSCLYVLDELFFLLTTTSYQASCLPQPGPQAGHPGWRPAAARVGVEESIGRQRRGQEWRSPLGGGGGAGPGVRAGSGVSGAMHTMVAPIERVKLLLHAGWQRRSARQGTQVRGSTFILVQHLS